MKNLIIVAGLILLMTPVVRGADRNSIDVNGNYQSESEVDEPQVFIGLKKGGSLSAKIVEPNKEKQIERKVKGHWSQRGNAVTISFSKGRCQYSFKESIEFYAGTSTGPGLECSKKSKLKLCQCSLRKVD